MTERRIGREQARLVDSGEILRGIGVLIVDDEEKVTRVLGRVLHGIFNGELGRIDVAHSKNDALSLIEDNYKNYGIIFTDGNMPNGSGLDLAEVIKQKELGIEMVLVSGGIRGYDLNNPRDIQEICSKYGIRKVIQKPFVPSEIKQAVSDILKKKA